MEGGEGEGKGRGRGREKRSIPAVHKSIPFFFFPIDESSRHPYARHHITTAQSPNFFDPSHKNLPTLPIRLKH